MLGNALVLAVLHVILAASSASSPDPVNDDALRAARLLGEFLSPLAERRPDGALESRLGDLVSKLGSEEWAVREAASKALVRCGMAAAPALREAARSRDPEVTFRAREALADIPAAALGRILDGLDVYLGGSTGSPQRRIVAELARIPAAAESTLARFQETERSAEGACERCAQEAEKAGDRTGGELQRLAGRIAKSRLGALAALAEHLNREVAELQAAEDMARETAKQAAKEASKAAPRQEAAVTAAVAVAEPRK